MGSLGDRAFVITELWTRGHNRMRKDLHLKRMNQYMFENWDVTRDTHSREGMFESIRYLSDELLSRFGYCSCCVQHNYTNRMRGSKAMQPRLAYAMTLAPAIKFYVPAAKFNPRTGYRSMERAWGHYQFGSANWHL